MHPIRDHQWLTSRRVQLLKARDGCLVLDRHHCDDTGAGAVVTQQHDGERHVHFFRPRVVRWIWEERALTSHHERLGVPGELRRMVKRERELRVAPHDLKVGEILAWVRRYRAYYVNFYRVVDVPHPRKVAITPVPSRLVEGHWSHGGVVPDLEAEPRGHASPVIRKVSMLSGEAEVQTKDNWARCTRWDGSILQVSSD